MESGRTALGSRLQVGLWYLGFRTGNTVSQNLSTVPVPAHTVPVPGMGIHRPVDMTVSPLTPR